MKTESEKNFSDLGLSERMLTQLTKLKFSNPTPIQAQSIPVVLQGKDVVGVAQTGTGKTLSFLLPMLERIAKKEGQGLVVLPTRELAAQVQEQLMQFRDVFGVRSALIIGGASMHRQRQDLKRNPQVIIATPGRLVDHMEGGGLSLKNVGMLVLDEADRMLDMGFAPELNKIMRAIPAQRQTLLFSATMPPQIFQLAKKYMKKPEKVEVAQAGTVAAKVEQEMFMIERARKNQMLDKLLKDYAGTTLVFTRTKHGARKVCRAVRGMGHTADELHSNLSLGQRRRSLAGFKSGKSRVLVATDIAARGIDVNDIELVINYDMPDSPDDYVHRVGRTGRAGKSGQAISFVTPDQRGRIRVIERLVRQQMRVSQTPDLSGYRLVLDEERGNYGRGQDRKRRYSNNRNSSRRTRPNQNRRPRRSGGVKSRTRIHAS